MVFKKVEWLRETHFSEKGNQNMDNKNTKVSLIIPCYNQGQYVDEAVKSVLDQTYQDFEIML